VQGGGFDLRPVAFEAELSKAFSGNTRNRDQSLLGVFMQRIFLAFINSMRALKYLAGNEKAVQQEMVLFLISLPVAFFLAPTWLAFLLMTGSILFLMMVEILNTGIEATCDAVSRDFHKEIQIAKDCGSLAVLIAIIFVVATWGYVLISSFYN